MQRRKYVDRVLAVVLGVALVSPVLAATPILPPIVEPASTEHHPGKMVFAELVTPDLATARSFYGGLLGWTFRDVRDGPNLYAAAYLDGRPVAGLIERKVPAGEHRQPAWLSFFAVADVDATDATAVQHGAKVLFDPHSIPNRGRESVLADPQGAVFGVLASSSGDPADFLAAPGEWIWSALITRDPDTDAAFYQSLFNYEVFELPSEQGRTHLLLASDDLARASANALPANQPNAHPHWLDFIRVDDAAAMSAKVTSLGGRVLVQPWTDRHGGKVAVVADPSGAPFGLMEWTADDTKAVTP